MKIQIKRLQSIDAPAWNSYVDNHPQATLYHLSGWKNIIEKTYGHKTYYLIAINNNQQHKDLLPQAQQSSSEAVLEPSASNIAGILPLVHLKHFLFGNSLISIPFFDLGGILADDEETEKALLSEAIKLGQKLKANSIELRHMEPLSCLAHSSQLTANGKKKPYEL